MRFFPIAAVERRRPPSQLVSHQQVPEIEISVPKECITKGEIPGGGSQGKIPWTGGLLWGQVLPTWR